MEYLFAPAGNYGDFASGQVIRSRPGLTAFPVRLASELFLRAVALLQERGCQPPYHIYDPVCGGGFALTAMGLLHPSLIRWITASDIDGEVVDLAKSNLALATSSGLAKRIEELEHLAKLYGRQNHKEAIASALRFQMNRPKLTDEIGSTVFVANALERDSISSKLNDKKIDIVFADIPYAQLSHWQGSETLQSGQSTTDRLLKAMAALTVIPKVIILATSKNENPKCLVLGRPKVLQNGKRRITIFNTPASDH